MPCALLSAADSASLQSDPQRAEVLVQTKWGITKTQFKNGSHSTSSESYQEVWHVRVNDEKVFLSSPRARIELVGLELGVSPSFDIKSLKIGRKQLFILLGIDGVNETTGTLGADKGITLDQRKGGLGSTKTLSFDLENEQQLQIELAINLEES